MSVESVPPFCPLLAAPPSSSHLAAWVRLALQPGLTPTQRRQLLRLADTPEAIVDLPQQVLQQTVGETVAKLLLAPPAPAEARLVEQALAWAQHPGQHVLVYSEPDYPPKLRHLHDPPLLLYVRGEPARLQRPMVALVGSRLASAAGSELAHTFARELAQAGWCVVSGLARGIDTAAHQGALTAHDGAGTVAIMANGIDRVYPPGNLELARRIVDAGAVLSELPLGAPSKAYHFPRRNRLVAALAHGVVVIEAAARSGSLITARLAAELGREVFAVPGSVHAAQVKGCHILIREGAQLVESTAEILQALAATPRLPLAAKACRWRTQELDLAPKEPELAPNALDLVPKEPVLASNEADLAPKEPDFDRKESDLERKEVNRTSSSTKAVSFRSERAALENKPTAVTPVAMGFEVPANLPAWVSPDLVAAVCQALGHDPASLDAILLRTGLPSPAVQTGLLALELAGRVRRLPDGRWEPLRSAGP